MLIQEGLKFKVNKVIDENREMLDKDGFTKRMRRIVNLAMNDGEGDLVKLTAFDPAFEVPKKGEIFTLPRVKRMECFDGIVQNVMV